MLLRRNNFPLWTILSPQPADNYPLRYVRDKARGSRILLWSRYVTLILRQTLWFPLYLSCSPLVGCRSYRRLCLIIFTYCLRAVYCTVCTARDVTNVCVFFINFSTKEKCSFSALHSKTTKHPWCSAGKHAYFCMFFSEMFTLNGLIYGILLLLDNDFQSNNVVRLHQFIVSTMSLWTIFEYSSDSA